MYLLTKFEMVFHKLDILDLETSVNTFISLTRETKFKNISLKDTTWRNIGEPFHLSCEDAKKYFKTLREKYFRVKRESEKESRCGSGVVTKEKWHLFELLRFLDEVSKPRKTIANTMKEAVSKLQNSMDVYAVPVDEADAVYSEVIEVNRSSEIFLDVDDTITVEEISNSSLSSCSSDKSNNSHPHAPIGQIPKKRKTTEDRVCSAMEKVVTALNESVPPPPTVASSGRNFTVKEVGKQEILNFKTWWSTYYKKTVCSMESKSPNKAKKVDFTISKFHYFEHDSKTPGIIKASVFINSFMLDTFPLHTPKTKIELPTERAYAEDQVPILPSKIHYLQNLVTYVPKQYRDFYYNIISTWPTKPVPT
ncbi:hypothetical protein FQA39_LY16855 [Lamprigera yunnana]|nr:hypothetical protein FQA39_LY16855 [Lamprigera yunnana]